MEIKKILWATDGSKESEEALSWAETLALAFPGGGGWGQIFTIDITGPFRIKARAYGQAITDSVSGCLLSRDLPG